MILDLEKKKAVAWRNNQNDLSTQLKLRSAWASAQTAFRLSMKTHQTDAQADLTQVILLVLWCLLSNMYYSFKSQWVLLICTNEKINIKTMKTNWCCFVCFVSCLLILITKDKVGAAVARLFSHLLYNLGVHQSGRHVKPLSCPRITCCEKTCLCHMRTMKTQISLRICAVWSAPLLFAAYSLCNIF